MWDKPFDLPIQYKLDSELATINFFFLISFPCSSSEAKNSFFFLTEVEFSTPSYENENYKKRQNKQIVGFEKITDDQRTPYERQHRIRWYFNF